MFTLFGTWQSGVWSHIRHAGLKAHVNVMCDRYKLVTVLVNGVMQGS